MHVLPNPPIYHEICLWMNGGLCLDWHGSFQLLHLYLALHKVSYNNLQNILLLGSHSNFTYNQNAFVTSRLFATLSNFDFAHTSISWSYGHSVLYIISPKDFNAAARIGPSLILMQVCLPRLMNMPQA